MKEIDFYKFCPKCQTAFQQKSTQLVYCKNCKRNLYISPRPCVTAVIKKEGKILFSKRAREPYKGKWDLPGGFVDYNESLIQALERELKEELGVKLKGAKYLDTTSGSYLWEGYQLQVLVSYFECEIIGKPNPSDDVAAIEWHQPSEYKMLGFKNIINIIKRYYLD